jgi:hypothetical protein
MSDYLESLNLLKQYPIVSMAPGHGFLIEQPIDYVNHLIHHRLQREHKIVKALQNAQEASIAELTEMAYDDVDKSLHPVASISLWAHLLKLEKERRARMLKGAENLTDQYWQFPA